MIVMWRTVFYDFGEGGQFVAACIGGNNFDVISAGAACLLATCASRMRTPPRNATAVPHRDAARHCMGGGGGGGVGGVMVLVAVVVE